VDWLQIRKLPIVDVASALGIEVRKNKAMCFGGHDMKTPSLNFSQKKNAWFCFGCGLGGGTVELVKNALGVSAVEAAKWLQVQFLVGNSAIKLVARAPRIQSRQIPIAPKIDRDVLQFVVEACPLELAGFEYLRKRGFDRATIQFFEVGELRNPRGLESALSKAFSEDRLLNSGVFKERTQGRVSLIWWDDCLLFPFSDPDGVSYIQARRFAINNPKYLNLIGTSPPLFNSQRLRSTPQGGRILVCEGIPDTMSAHQLGHAAVGCLGAASFRAEFATLLLPFEIAVVPDGDVAGDKFYIRVREAMAQLGRTVNRVLIPRGEDLTSAIQKKILDR
jgi:DNA primase